MSLVRFVMLMSLVVWLGGLICFAFVLAPTVFSVLPTRHLAGSVVSPSLSRLHWMGVISGIAFLVSSMTYARLTSGAVVHMKHNKTEEEQECQVAFLGPVRGGKAEIGLEFTAPRPTFWRVAFPPEDWTPKSPEARDPMGLDGPDAGVRGQFNALHVWSTRLEAGVLLLGLLVVYLTARHVT